MGFFFRKSVKFGPLRFNFSKSGVGVSAGVRGARVSTGPRGTFVTVGRNGYYYRQRIDPPETGPGERAYGEAQNGFGFRPSAPQPGAEYTESVGSEGFTDSTLENTLADLNTKLNTFARAPIAVALLTILVAALLLGVGYCGVILSEVFSHPRPGDEQLISTSIRAAWACGLTAVLVLFGGLLLVRRLRRSDRIRRNVRLVYELDAPARRRHNKVLQAFEALSRSSQIWSQQTQQATHDWKRNGGASTLVTRRAITAGMFEPPAMETNVPVCGLNFGQWQLFFLPDHIFVLNGRRYYAHPYAATRVTLSDTRFVENGHVPPDATVIDYTWLRVNRDGSPDRRYNYNRQIPVARYAVIDLTSDSGLQLRLQVSSLQRALDFGNLWDEAFASSDGGKRRASRGNTHGRTDAEEYVNGRPAWQILGVTPNASSDEVNSAYREKAKQYHPDRVEGLGPELKALAGEKMKEINAAYSALKKKFSHAGKGGNSERTDDDGSDREVRNGSGGRVPAEEWYASGLNLIPIPHGSNLAAWLLGIAFTCGLLLIFVISALQFTDARMVARVRESVAATTKAVPNINANTKANTSQAQKRPQAKVANVNRNVNAQGGSATPDVYLVEPAEEAPTEGPTDYSRIFKMSEVTKPARITYKPEPGFTEEARKNSVAGVVRLRAVLSSNGEVTGITVVKELPDGLTEKAVNAAKQIRFMPAEFNGRAVSQYVVLEYNFNIY